MISFKYTDDRIERWLEDLFADGTIIECEELYDRAERMWEASRKRVDKLLRFQLVKCADGKFSRDVYHAAHATSTTPPPFATGGGAIIYLRRTSAGQAIVVDGTEHSLISLVASLVERIERLEEQ